MTRRLTARPLIVIGAVMGLMLVVLFALGPDTSRASEDPADPTTLNHIARKNDEAAMEAAAKMREEARRAAEAADAQADFNDAMRAS